MRRAGHGMVAGLVTALVLGAAGCSASAGEGVNVPGDRLAVNVSEQLTRLVGQKPDAVRCPAMQDAKKGSVVRCTLTKGRQSLGVTVTATEVNGSDVRTDIEVDRTPQG